MIQKCEFIILAIVSVILRAVSVSEYDALAPAPPDGDGGLSSVFGCGLSLGPGFGAFEGCGGIRGPS